MRYSKIPEAPAIWQFQILARTSLEWETLYHYKAGRAKKGIIFFRYTAVPGSVKYGLIFEILSAARACWGLLYLIRKRTAMI